MSYDPQQQHHRRSIRSSEHDYSRPGAYFVTICIQDRTCVFGEVHGSHVHLTQAGYIAHRWWKQLPERYPTTALDAFIVMPNHVHSIIFIKHPVGAIHELPLQSKPEHNIKSRRQMLLPKMIGYYKMNTAKRINRLRHATGQMVWQRNYYDRIIRNERELNAIRQYIADNPLKWHLDKNHPDQM